MSAKIYIFPMLPSLKKQRDMRESIIVAHIMDEYADCPYPLVAKACDEARKALDNNGSAIDALEAAERVIYPRFNVKEFK